MNKRNGKVNLAKSIVNSFFNESSEKPGAINEITNGADIIKVSEEKIKYFIFTPDSQTTIIPLKAIRTEVPRSGWLKTKKIGKAKITIGSKVKINQALVKHLSCEMCCKPASLRYTPYLLSLLQLKYHKSKSSKIWDNFSIA